MTLLEVDDPSQLEAEIAAGLNLAVSRDGLQAFMALHRQPDTGFSSHMAEYLNGLQGYHFGTSDENRYRAVNETAPILKAEVEGLLSFSIECLEDIEARVEYYRSDEVAQSLKAQGYSVSQRAFNMTLLDLVDTYKPVATVVSPSAVV